MNKSLFALAALATVDIASAQSSVTLFGVVDAAVSGYKNTSETPLGVSVSKSQTAVTSSGYNGRVWAFAARKILVAVRLPTSGSRPASIPTLALALRSAA